MTARLFLFLVFFSTAALATEASSEAEGRLDFADGLYARKMYVPASSEYRRFLEQYPNSPQTASAVYRLADSFYYSKDYPAAVENFQRFCRSFPKDKRYDTALFRIGTALNNLNKPGPALRLFRTLVKKSQDPTLRAGALFHSAKALEAQGHAEAAQSVLRVLLKTYPQSEYAAYAGLWIGDALVKEKKYPEAITAYQASSHPNSPLEVYQEANLKIAEVYFLSQDYRQAARAYQKIYFEDGPDHPRASEDSKESERQKTLKEKALLGLFYCDLYLRNYEFALDRATRHKAAIEQSPHRAEIFTIVASLAMENNSPEPAMQSLDLALASRELTPEWKEKILLKRAAVLLSLGRHDAALENLSQILKLNGANAARAHLEMARVLEAAKKPKEAIEHYEIILTQYQNSDAFRQALFEIGPSLANLGQAAKALEALEKFQKLYPTDPDGPKALLRMMEIQMDQKNFQAVLSSADRLIQNHPGNEFLDYTYYKKAMALSALNEQEKAAECFKKLLENFPQSALVAQSTYGAGLSLENAGKPKEALFFYESLVRQFPEHELSKEIWPRIAYLYILSKEEDKASLVYQELLLRHPEVPVPQEGIFWLIQSLLNHGDYGKMKSILELIPKRFPGENLEHEIQFFLGESQMGLKNYGEAIAYYQKSIAAKPEGPYTPHATVGMAGAELALGDVASAARHFEEALKFDQEIKVTLRAQFELANLRLRQGKLDEAAKAFMMVAILYDDSKLVPIALYKAAECFLQLDRPEEAAKAFEELKSRYPKSELIRRLSAKTRKAA